jgi:hypothetical protein
LHRVSKLIALVALALLARIAAAQDQTWRPVTPEELQAKTPRVESDADAEAVFWEVRIDASKEDLSLSHYVRVKIYTDRGRELYSKFDIPFTRDTKIKDLAARVIRPDGSAVDIRKEDIYERDIIKAGREKLKAKSFAVPNAEPGIIIEYRYREVQNDQSAYGLRLPFQRDIPVQTLAYYYKSAKKDPPVFRSYNFSSPPAFVKDAGGFWSAKQTNVPAFREEPRMPPEDSVRPWIRFAGDLSYSFHGMFSSFTLTFKEAKEPIGYWSNFSSEMGQFVRYMNQNNGDLKKKAENLTTGAATADEKLGRLYDFCQNEIRNTNFEPVVSQEGIEKQDPELKTLLTKRSASAPMIDMLFGALAHSLGFQTGMAFSGDKRKILFNPDSMDRSSLVQAAIAVKVDKDWRFYAPGVKFLPQGMLPWYVEDSWTVIAFDGGWDIRQTPLTDINKSAWNRTAKFRIGDDGTLEGDVRIELTGHAALNYRLDNYDETTQKQENSLANQVKGRMSSAEVTAISFENLDAINKPVVELYHVRVPGYAQRTGKRLFIQPNFFKMGARPEFVGTTRKYDIFFSYPWSENDEISIEWPAGFDLDNVDAPGEVADPRKIGQLVVRMTADRKQNILTYSRKFHFGGDGGILYGAAAYPALKSLFDGFHLADEHTITLKQKQ